MAKDKKIKVLYITYLGALEPIPKSQALPYLFELSRDAEVRLLSFEKTWIIKKEPEGLRQTQNRLRDKGIRWYRLTYHKHPLFLSSVMDIFTGIIVSIFIVIRHKISIVHARSNVPIAIGYILKLVTPIKLLYDRRGIMGEDHTEHSGWKKGGFFHRLATWFEEKAIRGSDAIVVLTQKANVLLKNISSFGLNTYITTIPCCVDLALFHYEDDQALRNRMGLSDKFVFVYSGSVGTYNLLNEMFDFFKEAVGFIPNAHFLILTQNEHTVTDLLARREDIDKNRITVSYAPQEKLPSFLSIGDVGLVFRRTSPTAVAASPTKFGEYLACGLPVVSTPQIGDLEDIINSNEIGVVLTGYGKSDYIQAVTKLLILLKEKDILKKRCRKTAEETYSLARGARAYLSIYNQLARDRKS